MNRYHVKIEDTILLDSFTFDELIDNGLLDERDENIQVKLADDSEWVIARDYPFADAEKTTDISNSDGSLILNSENMVSNYTLNDDGTINRSGNFDKPPKPDTNLIWSIICISVCLPFGILALVESVKVDSLYSDGDYEGAKRASEKSKSWSMWCLWIWLIIFAIIIIATAANS